MSRNSSQVMPLVARPRVLDELEARKETKSCRVADVRVMS
jgi:hypothetical protein